MVYLCNSVCPFSTCGKELFVNIVVCIKQVPGTVKVKVDPETGTYRTDDSVDPIINPFDEYAIEEGLRLREKYEGVVKIVSMGPAGTERAIRNAIAMGADEGYHVTDPAFDGSDTWATAYTLAKAIKKIGEFDLIITDVVLPDRSGLDLVEHVLSKKSDQKVLLSSGYTDHKSQWPLIVEKGYPFLQKPYDFTELLIAMKQAMS